jgi:hypothetical protein
MEQASTLTEAAKALSRRSLADDALVAGSVRLAA